ncbi:hypothetical protein MNBD_GAMMA07-1692, partial [hydrothermal vent metagenome]
MRWNATTSGRLSLNSSNETDYVMYEFHGGPWELEKTPLDLLTFASGITLIGLALYL